MINSFRELLIRKANSEDLKKAASFISDEVLTELALESLEKMAINELKGAGANTAVHSFISEMDHQFEPDMMRDAIGHHVSHYKAAVKAGRQDIANKHAKQAMRIMNLAHKAQQHAKGKLNIDFIDPKPWEQAKYTKTYEPDHPLVAAGKRSVGDVVTRAKGLNYATTGNDFSFLQGQPHESYVKDIQKHGHNKAYPFEKVKVNGKFIHVDDIDPKEIKDYQPHEFDAHPIMSHFEESQQHRTPQRDQQYHEAKDKYLNESPHINKYFERHDKLSQDPNYEKRGEAVSKPVHNEIEGMPFPSLTSKAQDKTNAPSIKEAKQPKPNKPGDMSKINFQALESALGTDKLKEILSSPGVDLSSVPEDYLNKLGIKRG